jgi:hypothetical protein
MSYTVSVGKNLGLGSSGLYLRTSWKHIDIKMSAIDNGASLARGLPVTPCVINLRKGSERAGFQSPMMLVIGAPAEFELQLVLLTVVVMSLGSM